MSIVHTSQTMHRPLAIFSLTTAAALAGCGDGTGPLEPCSGPVQLSATGGLEPTLSWSPRCGAGSLLIDPAAPSSGGFDWRWAVMSGQRLIAPGVRYGVLPEGTTQNHPAVALEPGKPYTVVVLAPDGSEIAEEQFTP